MFSGWIYAVPIITFFDPIVIRTQMMLHSSDSNCVSRVWFFIAFEMYILLLHPPSHFHLLMVMSKCSSSSDSVGHLA